MRQPFEVDQSSIALLLLVLLRFRLLLVLLRLSLGLSLGCSFKPSWCQGGYTMCGVHTTTTIMTLFLPSHAPHTGLPPPDPRVGQPVWRRVPRTAALDRWVGAWKLLCWWNLSAGACVHDLALHARTGRQACRSSLHGIVRHGCLPRPSCIQTHAQTRCSTHRFAYSGTLLHAVFSSRSQPRLGVSWAGDRVPSARLQSTTSQLMR